MKKEKPKILILTSSFPAKNGSQIGGGNFILKLSEEISREFSPIVIAPFFQGGLSHEQINDIEVYRFKYLPFSFMYKYFSDGIFSGFKNHKILLPFILTFISSQIFAINKIIRKNKIKTIQANWIVPQCLAAVLYKKLFNKKINIICTSHGSDLNKLDSFFIRQIKKMVLLNISELTVVSDDLAKKAKNIGYPKTPKIIPMGVDVSQFQPNRNPIKSEVKKLSLLFVGRLSEEKGVFCIIEALKYLIKKNQGIDCIIIGDGPQKQQLLQRTKDYGLKEFIHFKGYIKNEELPGYFNMSDLVLMPSLNEGSPVVLAEAMSSECLVLASNIPIFKHHIKQNKNGFVSDPSNSKEYAEKIEYLLLNSQHLGETRKNARIYAIENFSWLEIGKQFRGLIYNLS